MVSEVLMKYEFSKRSRTQVWVLLENPYPREMYSFLLIPISIIYVNILIQGDDKKTVIGFACSQNLDEPGCNSIEKVYIYIVH